MYCNCVAIREQCNFMRSLRLRIAHFMLGGVFMTPIKKLLAIVLSLIMIINTFVICSFINAEGAENEFDGYTALSTKLDLLQLFTNPTGKFYLKNDIKFLASDFGPGGLFYNDGHGWDPRYQVGQETFYGVLDGNNHFISGLKINYDNSNTVEYETDGNVSGNLYAGFIPKANNEKNNSTTIKNLQLKNINYNIICKSKEYRNFQFMIGGMVGYVYSNSSRYSNLKINNCICSGKIYINCPDISAQPRNSGARKELGGIVGCVESGCQGEIVNCTNDIDMQLVSMNSVQATEENGVEWSYIFVGGILGYGCSYYSHLINFKNNINYGDIDVKCKDINVDAGGICGYYVGEYDYFSLFECCKNFGNLTSESICKLGGVFGIGNCVKISKCINTGTISNNTNETIYNTFYNNEKNCSGGLAGQMGNFFSVVNCYNTGIVTGNKYVGGAIGYVVCTPFRSPSIINFYNSSKIACKDGKEGFVIGGRYDSTVGENIHSSNCYFYKYPGSANNNLDILHGNACSKTQMKNKATYQGFDFDNVWDIDGSVNDGFPTLRMSDDANVSRNLNIGGKVQWSNTGCGLEYPIYNEDTFADELKDWIESSKMFSALQKYIGQYSFKDLLHLTVDVPATANGKYYLIEGNSNNSEIKDIMAYIMFANAVNEYMKKTEKKVRSYISDKDHKSAYTYFLDRVRTFNSQYYYFQKQLNGKDCYNKDMLSLMLASTAMKVFNENTSEGTQAVCKFYQGMEKATVNEGNSDYTALDYYVLSGGDTSYLSSGQIKTLKQYKNDLSNATAAFKIIKKGASSSSAINIGVNNLSYYADKYNSKYSGEIKQAQALWKSASDANSIISSYASGSLLGVASASWSLSQAYIDKMAGIYNGFEKKDTGWYALTYYYLGKNNKELLNALIDPETGSSEFNVDRIAKYGLPYNEGDSIEKSIISYWNSTGYVQHFFTTEQDQRMFLLKANSNLLSLVEMDCSSMIDTLVEYIDAKLNYEHNDTGVPMSVNLSSSNSETVSVSGGGSHYSTNTITVSTQSSDNSGFVGWVNKNNGLTVSKDKEYKFSANDDVDLEALYAPEGTNSDITPVVESISKDKTYTRGQNAENLSVTVTPVEGATTSVEWYICDTKDYDDGLVVSETSEYKPYTSDEGVYYYYARITNTIDSVSSTIVTDFVTITVNAPSISGIRISQLPNKLKYYVDSNVNKTGMIINAQYSDGTNSEIDSYALDYDFSTSGEKEVVVRFGNYSAKFNVNVIERTYKTIYFANSENWDTVNVKCSSEYNLSNEDALVTASYYKTSLDGYKIYSAQILREIDSVQFIDDNIDEINQETTIESLTDGNNLFYISDIKSEEESKKVFNIDSKEFDGSEDITIGILIGIKVLKEPIKKDYFIGDEINTSGLEVVLEYSDGVTKPTDNYSINYDFSSVGEKEVVIKYNKYQYKDYNDKFTVNVIEPTTESTATPVQNENVYITENGERINITDKTVRAADDTVLTGISNEFKNLEILGVQKKADESKHDIRFVTVINREIIKDAEDYGYIAIGASNMETARSVVEGYTLDTAPSKHVFSCRNSSNRISGEYGNKDSDTKYKYVTFAVNNIGENAVAAMFYVKDSKGKVYYAPYTNKDDITYNSCSANWEILS